MQTSARAQHNALLGEKGNGQTFRNLFQLRVAGFHRIAQTQDGLAVAVRGPPGSGIPDRILFRFWDGYDQPLTLAGDGESYTFDDRAPIVAADRGSGHRPACARAWGP